MLETYEFLYNGTAIRRATANLRKVYIPADGNLKGVGIQIPSGGFAGNWYFSVRYNGAILLSGFGDGDTNYLKVNSGSQYSSRPLDLAVLKGKPLQFDCVSAGTGRIESPIGFFFDLETADQYQPILEPEEVADEAARFALTDEDVTIGDIVKQTDTGKTYIVADLAELDNESGYILIGDPTKVVAVAADEAARFALTDLDIGDLVRQTDTEETYAVVDPDELDNSGGWQLIAEPGGGSSGGGVDIQTFATPGTYTAGVDGWVKPTGAKFVKVICVGGGGGGGAGRNGGSGAEARQGGAGGGGGARGVALYDAASLSGTETVVVGAGGAGGAGTTTGNNGNSGNPGGASSFGSLLYAGGGGAGYRGAIHGAAAGGGGGGGWNFKSGAAVTGGNGSTSAGTAGVVNGSVALVTNNAAPAINGGGGAGGSWPSTNANAWAPSTSLDGGAGGGAGGGYSAGGTSDLPSAGGLAGSYLTAGGGGASAGTNGSAGTAGSNGAAGDGYTVCGGGGGGGGGSNSNQNAGGAGGNGGFPGGGGGGGGCGANNSGVLLSGAGGSGGGGLVIVITYL